MANHTATKKSIRQTIRLTERNRSSRSRVKTFLRKVEEAITAKDKAVATEALRKAQSEMMSAVSKKIYKLNTASRKISRLSARIKAIG